MLRAVRHGQQVRKHHLRHALRAVGGYVGHDDAPFVGCLDVHHIIARSQHTDIFQPRQLGDDLPIDNDLVGQHHIRIGSPRHRLIGLRAVIHRHLAQLLQSIPRQIARICRITVKDYYLHCFFHTFFAHSFAKLIIIRYESHELHEKKRDEQHKIRVIHVIRAKKSLSVQRIFNFN